MLTRKSQILAVSNVKPHKTVVALLIVAAVQVSADRGRAGEISSTVDRLTFHQSDVINLAGLESRTDEKPFFFHLLPSKKDGSVLPEYGFTVDKGSLFKVELSDDVPGGRSVDSEERSLALTLTSEHATDIKDKVMFDFLAHNGPLAIDVTDSDTTYLLQFDLKFEKTYPISRFWAIHMQVWQCCGGHPPMSLQVEPNSDPNAPIVMLAKIYNDTSEQENFGQGVVIGRFSVERASWLHFAIRLTPSISASETVGGISLSLDGKDIFKWNGHWGYHPESMSSVSRTVLMKNLGIDFGIYRRREPNTQAVKLARISLSKISARSR